MASQTLSRSQKKNKKRKVFILCFFIAIIFAIGLYTIKSPHDKRISLFTNSISGDNTTKIQEEKIAPIKKAAQGFFTNIRFADKLYDIKPFAFKDIQGNEHTLAEFTGKPLLINLWAIWCAPCRMEMPELAQLKHEMNGENFDVIAINTDQTASAEKIQQFLQDVHADNLVYYRDETMSIFNNVRKQGLALGLPITLLIDKDGYLIASFNGAAPWSNDDAKALIKAIIMREMQ
ncbi:TlpA disulfide reductase family protein [Bartonella raoultii]|uniref:TlpA family protein disulfide reductase n=1 Tax=Bartonella raoultii TaxID=1457020 RepID=A0ABS7IBN0_9HYPH|nr:TlpA disulfide reductase family protein [Bartonella raoultii]MBX4335960.1 TlpA family protein disulfide reductase [Bartonella raoultii]